MTTDELIARLSEQATPVRHHPTWKAVCPAMLLGALASILMVAMTAGVASARDLPSLVERIGPGVASAALGLLALLPLLTPGAADERTLDLFLGGAVLLVLLLVWQITAAPVDGPLFDQPLEVMVRGPVNVMILALPVAGAQFVAIRRTAPTRLCLTGAALGLTPEVSPPPFTPCLPQILPSRLRYWFRL